MSLPANRKTDNDGLTPIRELPLRSKLLLSCFFLIALLNFYQAMRSGMSGLDIEGSPVSTRTERIEANYLALMHLFHSLIVSRLCLYLVQSEPHPVLTCWFPLYFLNVGLSCILHGIYATKPYQIEYILYACLLTISSIFYTIVVWNGTREPNEVPEAEECPATWHVPRIFVAAQAITALLQVLYPQVEVLFANSYDVDPVEGVNAAIHHSVFPWLGIFILRSTIYKVKWAKEGHLVYGWLCVIVFFVRLSIGDYIGIALAASSLTVAVVLYNLLEGASYLGSDVGVIEWRRKEGLYKFSSSSCSLAFFYIFGTIHTLAWFCESFFVIFQPNRSIPDVSISLLGMKFAGHAIFVLIIQTNCKIQSSGRWVLLGLIGGFSLLAWGQLPNTRQWPEITALCLIRAISATVSCISLVFDGCSNSKVHELTEVVPGPEEPKSNELLDYVESDEDDETTLRWVFTWMSYTMMALGLMFVLIQGVLFVFYRKHCSPVAMDAIGFHYAFVLPFGFAMVFAWGNFEVAAAGFFALMVVFAVGAYVFRAFPVLVLLFTMCTVLTTMLFFGTLKLLYHHMKVRNSQHLYAIADIEHPKTTKVQVT